MESLKEGKNSLFLTGFLVLFIIQALFVFYSGAMVSSHQSVDSVIFQYVFIAYSFLLLTCFFLIAEGIYLLLKLTLGKYWWVLYKNFYLTFFSVLIIVSVFEVKLFSVMGSHVYDTFILKSLSNSGLNKEIHLTASAYFSIGLFILFAIALPRGVFRAMKTFSVKRDFRGLKFLVPFIATGCTVFLVFNKDAVLKIEQALPLLEESGIISTKYIEVETKNPSQNLTEEYQTALADTSQIIKNKKNILFIVVESLRGDMLHSEFTPNLSIIYDSLSTIRSDWHFSGSHVTETGVFSALYGINPSNYGTFSSKSMPSLCLRILKNNHYKTIAVSSCPLSDWHGSGFMVHQFDEYKEFNTGFPNIDDKNAVEYLQDNFAKNISTSPVCYFLFLNSTHHNYFFPKEFEISKPVMEQSYNHFLGDNLLRFHKDKIFNRYKNSVRYVDFLIGKVVALFAEEIKKENLILVVTGDHAEEFWDKGFLGHGSANLYNCRTHVPLLFHLPGVASQHFLFSSHQCIFPTIVHYLTQEHYSKFEKFFDADFLLDEKEKPSSYGLIFSSEFATDRKICLINKNGKYWLKAEKNSPAAAIKKMLTFGDEEVIPIKKDSLLKEQLSEIFSTMKKYKNEQGRLK